MTGFELCSISKNYSGHNVLSEVSFTISMGQHTAILGHSGCGKSTALRIMAGLDMPDKGELMLNDTVASKTNAILVPPHNRGVAMVFQDLALWPNLSALDNVILGQGGTGSSRREKRERADEALKLCGIELLTKRLPGELSGGQQQRVALARAIATQPSFLFLDEPFAGLDLVIKVKLLSEIFSLAEGRQFTIVLVSHDPMEVKSLCSFAVLFGHGRVEEAGKLESLLYSSKSEFLRVFRRYISDY